MNQKSAEKALRCEILVPASLEEVWNAWTTEAGVVTFFAPACNIDLQPDGPYEIFFNPTAPPGERGGEGLRVMAVEPMKMLSFTWNAPPSLSAVRTQKTHVVVRFFPVDAANTTVVLHHDGWGEAGDWKKAFEYFDHAWKRIVLPRLRFRFIYGPVDWENPPSPESMARDS